MASAALKLQALMITSSENKKIRCFIACWPNAELQTELALLRHKFEDLEAIRWTPTEQIHLTLQFLGHIPLESAEGIAKMLNNIVMAPFDLEVHGLGAFPGTKRPSIIWAGVRRNETVLAELHKQVVEITKSFGIPAESRPFHPHITLARVKELNFNLAQGVSNKLNSLASISFGKWKVSDIVLMQSQLTPSGARYNRLAGITLR